MLLAVVGAVRLNNGASGGDRAGRRRHWLPAALLALMLPARGHARLATSRVLALVAASLLLATSLRGWTITGHDIQAEFLAFRLTNDAQHWQMGALRERLQRLPEREHPADRARADDRAVGRASSSRCCCSWCSPLVPVLTFLLSRRFLSRRLALVAATFTMAFPTFFTDMPYLVRQEIAFFFLALLLLAATEPAGRRGTRPLVAVLRRRASCCPTTPRPT